MMTGMILAMHSPGWRAPFANRQPRLFLCNNGGANSTAVSEHAILLMLAVRFANLWIGAAMILLTVAAVPRAAAIPLVLSAWAIATYTALRAPDLGVPSPAS